MPGVCKLLAEAAYAGSVLVPDVQEPGVVWALSGKAQDVAQDSPIRVERGRAAITQ